MKPKVLKTMKSLGVTLLTVFTVVGCSSSNVTKSTNSSEKPAENNTAQPSNETKKDEKINIKIATVVAEDTTNHKRFVKFKELIEERSKGHFQVEIFPNSALGGEREIVEGLQIGSIQMASPSVGVISNFSTGLRAFDLPFIFKDTKTAYEVLDGPIGQEMLKQLESNGIVGLGYGENGWRHLTSAKGPIISPDQLNGMKLRTMEVDLHMAFWKLLGANPTPMAFSEVFTALSQGVIDGQENPFELIYSMKFHEPNKFITTTGHIYDSEVVITNKQFMDSLSPEDQKLIKDCVKEAIDYQRNLNKDAEDQLRQKLTNEGVTITDLTPEQKQVWIEKVKPIYEEYADEVGRDTLKKLLKEAGNTAALESLK